MVEGHGDDETMTLWRPTGQAERDLVATSGWRAWPPRLPEQPIFYPVLNRWYATKITREWNVPHGGVGYVMRFEVRREFLNRYPVCQVGGRDVLEYQIPAEDLPDLNASIARPIIEEACYRGLVPDEDFDHAERRLGRRFPGAWREYLQGPSWFEQGWLASGMYLSFLRPAASAEYVGAWSQSAELHPGVVILGTDGSREQLAVDARLDDPPVVLADITSQDWGDAIRQADSVAQFIAQVEDGSFTFLFQ
jgi:hypothetical protein